MCQFSFLARESLPAYLPVNFSKRCHLVPSGAICAGKTVVGRRPCPERVRESCSAEMDQGPRPHGANTCEHPLRDLEKFSLVNEHGCCRATMPMGELPLKSDWLCFRFYCSCSPLFFHEKPELLTSGAKISCPAWGPRPHGANTCEHPLRDLEKFSLVNEHESQAAAPARAWRYSHFDEHDCANSAHWPRATSPTESPIWRRPCWAVRKPPRPPSCGSSSCNSRDSW